MPGQRWEIIALLLAIALQVVYQYLYVMIPKNMSERMQSGFDAFSHALYVLRSSMHKSSTGTLSPAEPVFTLLGEHVFDGSGKCVGHRAGASSDLPMAGTPYTVEAWVMPRDVRSNESFGIVGWGDTVQNKLNGFIFFRGANSLRSVWWQNDLQAMCNRSLADGKFHHVAAIWDGITHSIAVDFEVLASRSAERYSATNKANFCVGRAWHQDGTYANFKGRIRDLKIWNISRSVLDMKQDSDMSVDHAFAPRNKEPSSGIAYRVHTMRGFLNIHSEPGDPYRTDNVLDTWSEGDTFLAVGDVVETRYGPWIQSARGWSIVVHDGYEFLERIGEATKDTVPVILLDDGDSKVTGLWYHGTYEPCLVDAFGGMFHHDWGHTKGQMFGRYPFGPLSKGGCYEFEEWHPGKLEACAFYLTRVSVAVVSEGQIRATYHIDQSIAGGRWNKLGRLDLPLAYVGDLQTWNNGTGTGCQAKRLNLGECFWVADAFRLRLVAESCTKP